MRSGVDHKRMDGLPEFEGIKTVNRRRSRRTAVPGGLLTANRERRNARVGADRRVHMRQRGACAPKGRFQGAGHRVRIWLASLRFRRGRGGHGADPGLSAVDGSTPCAVAHSREDRMKTDIGIWEIDRESRAANKLGLAKRVVTEDLLEAVLVANPNMLMRGLTLVGRQVPVETGYVDLLGVDEDGRLVVFELKRDRLTRDAVAQILDYCTCLETLSDLELATLMAERSGKDGIKKIADFWEWYGSQPGDSIRPVRMVLVGLGINLSAHRMVAYLADRGIDIRLLTFHGYVQGDGMLLARQVRTANQLLPAPPNPPRDRDLNRKAIEHGVAKVWQDARKSLDYSVRTYYTKSGITYLQRTITLPDDVRVRGLHSVTIDEAG